MRHYPDKKVPPAMEATGSGNSESESESGNNPVIVKKYANRRLYNTATSKYVTLNDLHHMVRDSIDFKVCDARTGEDITRSILTQIILEEEGKEGGTLLPVSFLRQLISLYGDQFNHMTLPRYLEASMHNFAENQNKLRQAAQESFSPLFPIHNLEEMGKQNMEFMRKAMTMFNPLAAASESADPAARQPAPMPDTQPVEASPPAQQTAEQSPASPPDGSAPNGQATAEDVRRQLDDMQGQINTLIKALQTQAQTHPSKTDTDQ